MRRGRIRCTNVAIKKANFHKRACVRFIPFGSDTPKLASALMRVKMGNGESIYTQKTQCFGADVSLGVCC
jgi:hypothetical protein